MKTPTKVKVQTIQDRIEFIEKTIKRLGSCSINTEKLTSDDISKLRQHFTVEHSMGYTRFEKN